MALLIGATMNETDLPTFKVPLAGNNIMRIFPSTKTVAAGKNLPVLPNWTDSRFLYCQEANVIPFVSTKVDGDTDGLNFVKAQLQAMPSWVTTLYITDRHEPEGDLPALTYQANFNAFLAMIDSLPSGIRSRIKCGPVLTKTWTEKSGGGSLSVTDGAFEAGTLSGWGSPSGGTFAPNASQARTGSWSGLLTTTGTPTQTFVRSTPNVPVVPGSQYRLTMWIKSIAARSNVQASIDWFNAAGSYISTSAQTLSLAANTWTSFDATQTAPAGAASCSFGPTMGSSPATGSQIYVDDIDFLQVGSRTYSTHDPGTGDFFGVDMYVESGTSSTVVTTSTLPDPATFVAAFKAYRKTVSDTRPRIWPELGVIGMPDDLDGTARANWIIGLYNQVRTWTIGSQGWNFLGFIWWHAEGKATGVVYQIGQRRDFPLHLRTAAGTAGANYADSYAVQLPGTPPKPTAAYNAVYLAENPVVYEPGTTPPLPSDAPPSADAMLAEYEVVITDKNLNVVGDPIYNWTTLDITLRFNEPGSGQFTAPGYPWIREQLAPSNRVVCIRRVLGTANVLLAGPIESVQYERADDGENGGVGKLTVTWADDLVWLAGRVAYPEPAKTPETQALDYWTWSGSTEAGLYALVNQNLGPGAQAIRRVPQLVMAPIRSLPGTVTVSATLGQARFTPVSATARDMAERGGTLGFRTYQAMAEKQIVFEVYQPRDLSGQVRFSFDLGNLKYLMYEQAMPEANTVIVGGQFNADDVAAGADKYVMEVKDTLDATTWGRMETYVARPGNDPVADLTAEANAELADKLESSRLQSTASDTIDQRFGVHYFLGDRVAIEFWTGQQLVDIVRTVHVQAWPTAGEVVSATIGTQSTTYEKTVNRSLRTIDRRVGRLERNAAVKQPTT